MKVLRTLFLILVTLLSLFVSITGLTARIDLAARFLQILFLPVTAYLLYILAEHILAKTPVFDQKTGYFLILVWPHRKAALPLKRSEFKLLPATEPKVDVNRRDLLKLIGSAGILALILGLFGRRGGLPNLLGNTNLDSVTLKDPSGNVINPAQDSPTDGYSISQVDDSVPSYLGFVNREGSWFIMREGEDSSFRYVKGEVNFGINWTNRTKLNYNYFDKVF
ncbi:hypothetical protein HYT60_02640 [Candidatus Woesebacteria bacterium]|nr:hypothetical protein [Candidatus Woesebacteria bacterium]